MFQWAVMPVKNVKSRLARRLFCGLAQDLQQGFALLVEQGWFKA
jgi:hypothetical protein